MNILGKLSIRILSIFLLVKSLNSLLNYFTYYLPLMHQLDANTIQARFNVMPLIPTILVTLVIAILLWVFTDKIVVLMIGKKETNSIQLNVSYHQLLHIVLKVLGIIIIINAIPSFIEKLIVLSQLNLNYYNFYGKFFQLLNVLVPIFRILIGIVLIFANRYFKLDKHPEV